MATTYRASLQVSLHDAPNPVDPIGATDWGETRASDFVAVDVEMTGGRLIRDLGSSLVATRALVARGGVGDLRRPVGPGEARVLGPFGWSDRRG